MRKYIDIVGQAAMLLEHNVINDSAIAEYCKQFADQVTTPFAKSWFMKKLRSIIINDASFLDEIPVDEAEARFRRNEEPVPAYVHAAALNNEPLYLFLGFSPETRPRIEHIVHVFQSLEKAAKSNPDKENQINVRKKVEALKFLNKLPKMDLAQVEAASQEWDKIATAGMTTPAIDGADIVMQWPDGYYAIQFTKLDTMTHDGALLQNCLAHGTYWRNVQNGSLKIYAIRRPNGEPVVGIAIDPRDGDIHECKGKNNKAVGAPYTRYVADLLAHEGAKGTSRDLISAGIVYANGKYGSFFDLAETTTVDGVQIKYLFQSDNRMKAVVSVEDHSYDISHEDTRSGHGVAIGELKNAPVDTLKRVLNALATPIEGHDRGILPAPYLKKMMEPKGLFFNNGAWGTFADTAEHIVKDGVDLYRSGDEILGKYDQTELKLTVKESSWNITIVEGSNNTTENISRIMNAANENLHSHDGVGAMRLRSFFGVVYSHGSWGDVREKGELIGSVNGNNAYNVNDRYIVVMDNSVGSDMHTFSCDLTGEEVDISNAIRQLDVPEQVEFMNLLEKSGYTVKGDKNDIATNGILKTSKGWTEIENVGTIVGKVENNDIYRYKNIWMMNGPFAEREWVQFKVSHGVLSDPVGSSHNNLSKFAQFILINNEDVTNVTGKSKFVYGLVRRRGKILKTARQVLDALKSVGEKAAYGPCLGLNDQDWIAFLDSQIFENMTKNEAMELLTIFIPSAPFQVEETSAPIVWHSGAKPLSNLTITLPYNIAYYLNFGGFNEYPTIQLKAEQAKAKISAAALRWIKSQKGKAIVSANDVGYNTNRNLGYNINSEIRDTNAATRNLVVSKSETKKAKSSEDLFGTLNIKRLI